MGTRTRMPARATKEMREQFATLFNRKFRPSPMPRLHPTFSPNEMAAKWKEEIAEMPEFQTAVEAVTRLTNAVNERYAVSNTSLSVNSSGEMHLQYESSNYSASNAMDAVNVYRRRVNKEADAKNRALEEAHAKDVEAWEMEQEEKRTVIRTAETVNEILTLVPEVRVNLPTEQDRELLYGYVPGQRTTQPMIESGPPTGHGVTIEVEAQ